MSDQELIQKILEGDKHCFRDLVQQYHVMVINTCYGLVHIREDAEDVAQEVFLEIYQSLARFRSESRLSTWIYRIAVNKSINYLRKVKVRQRTKSIEPAYSHDDHEGMQVPAAASENPFNILNNKERSKFLYEALDALPENQKIAFVLHQYEDLSYKEITDIMKLSLSAVESLIHRAKINLQKKLMDYYKDK
jgi:RNA polymerase sigma-70 factor, ECF subfamily